MDIDGQQLYIRHLVEDEDADEVDGCAGGGDEERGVPLEDQRIYDVCASAEFFFTFDPLLRKTKSRNLPTFGHV